MCLVVGLSPGALAQKGVGLFPAGAYHFTSTGVDFSSSNSNMSVFLSVSANTDVSQPQGQPQTTTSETQVFVSLFDFSSGFTFACLVLDHPSDFTIDKRLKTASLATTLGPSTPTCPFSAPLTSTIGLTGSWTGTGPVTSSDDKSNYVCGGYSAKSVGRNLGNLGTANLTIATGGTSTTLSSNQIGLNSNDLKVEADGVGDPGCGPAGVGTGPIAAGKYHFFGLMANSFFGMPPDPTNQISLNENNQVSVPTGGTPTSTQEFDLNVSMFGGSFNGYGCWIISPSDVTSNGLSSATIQATITATTPLCTNSFPGFGINYPLTVTATWTATGPLITVSDKNNFKCADYTAKTVSSVQSRSATSTATITMPDYLGNPVPQSLTGGVGSITHIDQRIEADGVEQQACFSRG
jgi:hypothetical protein